MSWLGQGLEVGTLYPTQTVGSVHFPGQPSGISMENGGMGPSPMIVLCHGWTEVKQLSTS